MTLLATIQPTNSWYLILSAVLFGIGAVGVLVRRNPLVILDGAHNPDGAEAAAAVLAEDFTVEGRRILVCGMLEARDPVTMLQSLDAGGFGNFRFRKHRIRHEERGEPGPAAHDPRPGARSE